MCTAEHCIESLKKREESDLPKNAQITNPGGPRRAGLLRELLPRPVPNPGHCPGAAAFTHSAYTYTCYATKTSMISAWPHASAELRVRLQGSGVLPERSRAAPFKNSSPGWRKHSSVLRYFSIFIKFSVFFISFGGGLGATVLLTAPWPDGSCGVPFLLINTS